MDIEIPEKCRICQRDIGDPIKCPILRELIGRGLIAFVCPKQKNNIIP